MENSNILIVDDSRLFAEFLHSVVTKRGYASVVASSGRDALNALKDSKFNLILLDLELPDIHGNELLKIIRANSQFNEVAVIVISGTNDPDKIIKSLELGANDFISKPFNEMMLGLKIKNLLMLQKSNELLKDEVLLHKSTLNELSLAKNDLETVFQSSPIAMIIIDENIKIKKTNHAANEFFKKNPVEVTGLDPGELVHCINVQLEHKECGKGERCKSCHLRNTLNETIDTKSNINKRKSEIQVLSDSGIVTLTLFISSIVIQIEGTNHILLCIEDISERSAYEKALLTSEKKYKTLFQNIPIGLTITDITGQIIESNVVSEKLLGLSTIDQEKRTLTSSEWKIIKPDCSPMLPAEFASVRAMEENKLIENVEMGIVKSTNEITWISVTAAPLDIENYGVVIAYMDITERVQMVTALKELIITKEKLLSVIAHDLRNPFNILLGMSEMLIKKLENNELDKVKSYAQHLHKTSEQTYNLLENLLSWSRAQTGKLIPKKCHFNIPDVMMELQRLLTSELAEKRLTITEHIPSELFVFADPNMIKTVFRNLLTNAIKFSHPGNTITVSAIEKNNFVEICIADNGVGIAPEDIPKMFKIESNVSTPGTAEEQGSGLGLVICKEFIELNKGKIWVKSRPDDGSSFYFSLLKDNADIV